MRLFILILSIATICSCATKKEIFYLQDLPSEINNLSFLNFPIQSGDILDIKITALNEESVQIFQPLSQKSIGISSLDLRKVEAQIVDDKGNIELPLIGKINTNNKTPQDLSDFLVKKLTPYVKNPNVKVMILNFKISVLGEVNKPATHNILEEKINFLQALGLSGDLTINGDRTNIILLRSNNDKKISYKIDLTKSDLMESEFYYLKQNDIIYVPPNFSKVKSSGVIGNVGVLTSVLSLILSLSVVLTR